MSEDRKLPLFTGKDFSVWRAQVEAYIAYKSEINPLVDAKPNRILAGTSNDPKGPPAVINVDLEAKAAERERLIRSWERAELFLKTNLLNALDNKHAKLILKCKTSRQMWERLISLHEQTSQANKIVLQREFFDLQMGREEKVQDFITRAEYLHGQLLDIGVELSSDTLVSKIVSGLPKRFLGFMSNWSVLEEKKQTMCELIARLTAEEQLLDKFKRPTENALTGELKSRFGGKNNKFKNKKGDKQDNKDKKCYICKQKGHLKRDCPKRGKKKEKNDNNDDQEVAICEDLAKSVQRDCAIVVEEVNIVHDDATWIIDTGASKHMTYELDDFDNIRELGEEKDVLFGDRSSAPVEGIGDVTIKVIVDGKEKAVVLRDTYYVPQLRRKLISISSATSRGCTGEIFSDKMVVSKNGKAMVVGVKQGGLYVVQLAERVVDFTSEVDDNSKLWHARLGHINQRYVTSTAKAVKGMEPICRIKDRGAGDVINCDACQVGKLAKVSIPLRRSDRASIVGERVHVDICGPVGASTISGAKYFALFKDEFSCYRFIYAMKSREEAYDCLRKTIAYIESQGKSKVRCLVSDLGSEFTSKRTQEFLLNEKIVHKTSAPACPAQNGFIERDNRTVMEGVRSLLRHMKVPCELWGEAANTMVYLLNRCVNFTTAPATPFERMHKVQPQLGHLKVFGCLAFVKTPTKKRSGYQPKLEDRAIEGVHVGYEQDFTYRVYNPSARSVIISRDVVFDERRSMYKTDSDYKALDDLVDSLLDEAADSEREDDAEEVFLTMTENEPTSYREAVSCADSSLWRKAMEEEYESLIRNKTWTLCELPEGRQAIGCKWVFKIKYKADGAIDRYKGRLVALGYRQRREVDYWETFSPVVRTDSIRVLLALAVQFDLDIVQLDVKTAFLYGDIDVDLYMNQPEGFVKDKRSVCRLNKSIYGLKQSSRQWNECFTRFLQDFDLEPLKSDTCVFVNKGCRLDGKGDVLLICIYVDDGLLMSNSKLLMERCLNHLRGKFEIKTSTPDVFVGLQIERDRKRQLMRIHQQQYIERIVRRFDLHESRPISVPMDPNLKLCKEGVVGSTSKEVDVPYTSAIGSLMYAALGTRLDITFSVNVLSRFSSKPRLAHWEAAKRVIRYLTDKSSQGIVYTKRDTIVVECYSDADHAGCHDSRKSTSGFVVVINGAPVIWRTTKQTTVAVSTTEAEFVAASTAAREVLWLRNLLGELGLVLKPTVLHCDNLGTVRLITNDQSHARTKHLDTKIHDVRLMNKKTAHQDRVIEVKFIPGENQLADILTKALARPRFVKLLDSLAFGGGNSGSEMKIGAVAFLALVVSSTTGNGYLLRDSVAQETHLRSVAFSHMCNLVFNETESTEKEQREVHAGRITALKKDNCLTSTGWKWYFCAQQHLSLQEILERLPSSTSHIIYRGPYQDRFKRGTMDDLMVNGVNLAYDVIKEAACYWIGGVVSTAAQVGISLASDLLSALRSHGRTLYNNKTLVPLEVLEREIAGVSIFAKDRPDVLKRVVQVDNYADTFLEHAFNEMKAAEVLLLSIEDYARIGMMDAQALGELIDEDYLKGIQTHQTRLLKIEEEFESGADSKLGLVIIKFAFIVYHDRSIFDRIILMDLLGLVAIIAVSFMFGGSTYWFFVRPRITDWLKRSRRKVSSNGSAAELREPEQACSLPSANSVADMLERGTLRGSVRSAVPFGQGNQVGSILGMSTFISESQMGASTSGGGVVSNEELRTAL